MRRRSRRAWAGGVVVLLASLSVGLSTDLHAPPRYDGAGYSVLALSLVRGRGYREIARPDAPPHAHLPPGYPIALAGLWTITGRSVVAAHVFSIACTIAAVWLAWRWFCRVELPGVANGLGLALAINWTWGMVGGSIQSEPLYLLLSMAALNLSRKAGLRADVGLGLLLGACVLTRHVGVCLLLAVVTGGFAGASDDRARWRRAGVVVLGATAVVAPWIIWLATVRRETQVGLLDAGGLAPRIASQAIFYARRMPDALTGPFVEVATVFSRSKALAMAATAAAIVASSVLLIGMIRAAINPRRRLVGLVPLVSLPLLLAWPFTEAGRFLIPLVPCLMVGAVEGMAWIEGLFPRRTRKRNPRHCAAVLLLLLAVPYPAYALITRRAEAQRRTHADFDAACAWIAREATESGPVVTRHPGEVFWQTGRLSVAPASDDLDTLTHQLKEQDVAYLLIDPDRYANAPPTPLSRLVAERPGTVRRVFGGPVAVYEVRRDSGP